MTYQSSNLFLFLPNGSCLRTFWLVLADENFDAFLLLVTNEVSVIIVMILLSNYCHIFACLRSRSWHLVNSHCISHVWFVYVHHLSSWARFWNDSLRRAIAVCLDNWFLPVRHTAVRLHTLPRCHGDSALSSRNSLRVARNVAIPSTCFLFNPYLSSCVIQRQISILLLLGSRLRMNRWLHCNLVFFEHLDGKFFP